MDLHGSITENLEAATASARRLRGRPVYKDTLTYWNQLLQEARRARPDPSGFQSTLLDAAIVKLENELAIRTE
jgi:hypothetical protein